jgi:hypothetical protein
VRSALRTLVLAILFVTGCDSTDASSSREDAFISQVREKASFPDDDDVLMAVGHQFCVEITENGEEAALANIDQSSFSFDQKLVLSVSARQHLCPDE